MRLVWAVIPLILIVSMIGIIGMQESFATPPSLGFVTIEISHYPKLNEVATVTVTSINPYSHDLTLDDNEYLTIRISDSFEFVNVPPEQIQIHSWTYGTDYYIQEPLLAQQNQTQSLTVEIRPVIEGKQNINVSGAAKDNTGLVLFVDAVEGLPYNEYMDKHPEILAQIINSIPETNNDEPYPTIDESTQISESHPITDEELRKVLRTDGYTEEEINKIIHTSPKKQLESGITPENIICKYGLELIFKSSNNYPSCVKPSTAERLVERGWTIVIGVKIENKTSDILLYSSKLTLDSDANSSTPLPPAPYDYEITLSKIPKLGETATISMIYSLKDGWDSEFWTGNTIPVKFGMENGFDFPTLDKSSPNFERISTFTDFSVYTVYAQMSDTSPTVFEIEIMPTRVGNWIVYVDGGGYQYSQNFYFIVTEDETILGEKPPKHVSTIIPGWIKDNFGWWERGQIKDMKLDNSVQALIKFGILDVNTENIPQEVPPQFRQDIRDWHAGLLSDADFLVILKDWVENYS